MKKTCMNCKYYHNTLSDAAGGFYHIHDWCAQWKVPLKAFAMAELLGLDAPYYSDLETGIAFCYMYESAEKPAFPDEWFERNKAVNEKMKRNLRCTSQDINHRKRT